MDVKVLIRDLGGPAAVARDLGFGGRKGTCRVSMWMNRNRIPAEIQLKHLDYFKVFDSKKPSAIKNESRA